MNSRMSKNVVHSLENENGLDKAGKDRLSEMPDEVILHILSFLPTLDAVRTVLLRRFGNLWTQVSSLSFNYQNPREAVTDNKNKYGVWSILTYGDGGLFESFSRLVRNVLVLHKRLIIDKLCLRCELYKTTKKRGDAMRMWLSLALGKDVKELEFFVEYYGRIFENPVLPALASQSLVKLVLYGCTISPQHKIHLESLKQLRLSNVNVGNEAFQYLISGCPSLQELHISYPISLGELRFTAPNIVKLSLCLGDDDFPCVLDCPNLKTLNLACRSVPEVVNLSSVREFNSSICFLNYKSSYSGNAGKLERLLRKLEDAETFKLSEYNSEGFFLLFKNVELPQNRWKRVVLKVSHFTEDRLLGFYHLARSLEELEELTVIYTRWVPLPCSKLRPLDLSSLWLMPKLRTVTMHGFENPCEGQLQLVEFLLKSAAVLDIFQIVLGEHQLKAAEELGFVKSVSGFRRISKNARVVFT